MKYLWTELTSAELRSLKDEDPIVLIPVGAVEQHGPHLPTGVDGYLAESVCVGAAKLANKSGLRTVVLPVQWVGYSPHHLSLGGSLSLSCETLVAVLTELSVSLVQQGYRRVLLVNGHGGNGACVDMAATDAGRQMYGQGIIGALSYFSLVSERQSEFRESGSGGMGHACEFETSLMLSLYPELVEMERVQDHIPQPYLQNTNNDLFGSKKVRIYREYSAVTPNGVVGQPSLATSEKGEIIFEICCEELAQTIKNISEKEITN
ncbi:creatininase family protein [Hoeflea sp. G2-23]|uniref:Creatininase family protein n=1 Tax=Hoeflea algicola TaxID=2983763 RepID=A0ABT3Z505_9HYPH|nr:creatininase family protein [Hoeflea algicola]MCY0146822.1 creatininase family protein [Hoeflea algicola]